MQIEFPQAELSIVEVNGCSTQSNSTLIRINGISERGFSFTSSLRFPVNPQIMLNLRFSYQGETLDLQGMINGSRSERGGYRFIVVFNSNEQVISKLTQLLKSFARQYTMQRLRAEYYYNTYAEETYSFKNSQINICM